MSLTALYPGTFDPVTLGHLDVMRRAAALVERLAGVQGVEQPDPVGDQREGHGDAVEVGDDERRRDQPELARQVGAGAGEMQGGEALLVQPGGTLREVLIVRLPGGDRVVDIDAPGSCAVLDYWEPIQARGPRRLILDPDEPRLLRKADPAKGETPEYVLLIEGIDNDGDGRFNEDGPHGSAGGGIDRLRPGALVIDMGSSAPRATRSTSRIAAAGGTAPPACW